MNTNVCIMFSSAYRVIFLCGILCQVIVCIHPYVCKHACLCTCNIYVKLCKISMDLMRTNGLKHAICRDIKQTRTHADTWYSILRDSQLTRQLLNTLHQALTDGSGLGRHLHGETPGNDNTHKAHIPPTHPPTHNKETRQHASTLSTSPVASCIGNTRASTAPNPPGCSSTLAPFEATPCDTPNI